MRCADLERAGRFYTALGLRVRYEQRDAVAVRCTAEMGDLLLELSPRAGRAGRESAGLELTITVAGLELIVRRAVRAGAILLGALPGVLATLEDPDGHRIIVRERETSPRARLAPARVRARIAQAFEAGDLVTMRRVGLEFPDRGYVVALGRGLVALASVDDRVVFDGYRIVRLRDVSDVEVEDGRRSFDGRALALRGLMPPPRWPRALSLSSVSALVTAAARRYRLIALYLERDDPTICWIGRVLSIRRGVVRLHEVTPEGDWDEIDEIPVERITRVDLGGSYETALALVAPRRRA